MEDRKAELEIPEALIERFRAGRGALVVGSSFGLLAGLPSWKKLIERLRDELQRRNGPGDAAAVHDVAGLLKKGRLTAASSFLARTLGSAACDALVRDVWRTPEKLPAAARLLGQIPVPAVWTTHPGDLVEKLLRVGSPPDWPDPRVVTYDGTAGLDPRKRYVLKLFGDIDLPDSYVVTPSSVRRALAPDVQLRNLLADLYRDGALVFVGYRHGDPDLHALLERVFAGFEPPKGEHYFVGAGLGPVDTAELESEHHMKVIALEAGGGERATDALASFLGALSVACERAGLSLSVSRPAPDDLEAWTARLEEDAKDGEARDAIAAMEKRAREAGQQERLVEILLSRAEHEPDGLRRSAVLRDLARTFEVEIGDLPRAFTALTAAMREHPEDDEIVAEAERLAAETDGWGELIADLSEVVPQIEDKKVAAGHWTRLGRWYQQKLRHDDYAVASYREALKLDPARLDARQALAELYRRQQRWGELAEELVVHAEVETDAGKRVELLLALGDLNETTLASTQRAIDAYEKVLAAEPGNDDALAALERLYRRGEHWGRLVAVLERRAQNIENEDAARAASIRRELAQLRADKLGDVEGAVARYEASLATNDRDLEAIGALERLYEKVGRAEDALRMLERRAEIGPEGERASLWRLLAASVEEREGGATRAIRCYERVLDLEPNALDAYRSLERLYRGEQAWDSIVSLYQRQIGGPTPPSAKVELYGALGRLLEQELHDPHRAIEAHVQALDLQPESKETLAALARLYKRIESWEKAVATLERHAELAATATLWHEAGSVLLRNLADEAGAESRFAKALEVDATFVPSLLSLIEIAKRRKDWARAVKLLEEAERHTGNRLDKIGLLLDAAQITGERLDQKERAIELSQRILALDPEHVEAGLRVAEHLVGRGEWAQAEPVLDMLARKADPADHFEAARRNTELARAAEKLGNLDKAVRCYGAAIAADAGAIDAALGLGFALFAKKDWAGTDVLLRDTLARHRPALAQGQVIECWHTIGLAARARGEAQAAEDAFRRALELDPGHRASLAQIVELGTERGDFKAVVQAKRDALEGSGEEERLRLLEEIGDITWQKLADPVGALGVFLEALSMRPRSHQLLHKTLEIYTEQKEWRRAIDALDRLAELERDSSVRAKYHYAGAVIARDELVSAEEAVERFTQALDDAPTIAKAFEAIERILGDKQDWKGLVRAYKGMIKRLGERATAEQQLHLWKGLGDVARDKLGDTEAAIAAYEVAATLDPGNLERHRELASLYLAAGPDRRDKAIAELQMVLRRVPDDMDVYRGLWRLYMETRQPDKAYCLAQAMTLLGQAGPDERRILERFRPKTTVLARRRLTEELWQKAILHPREDRLLNGIFGSLMASFAATTAQPHAALALNTKESSPAQDPHPLARLVRYAVQVLGIAPEPELYLRPLQMDGIQAANVAEKGILTPALLISQPHVTRKADADNLFDVGKKLSFFRPERYVVYALHTLPRIEAAFEAALTATGFLPGKHEPEVEKLVGHLKRTVPEPLLQHVATLARKHPAAVGNGAIAYSIGAWITACDLTANRVGLILANDLETAARMIATEKVTTSTMGAKERLRDLLGYAASEEYFMVRRHLGLDVTLDAGAQPS